MTMASVHPLPNHKSRMNGRLNVSELLGFTSFSTQLYELLSDVVSPIYFPSAQLKTNKTNSSNCDQNKTSSLRSQKNITRRRMTKEKSNILMIDLHKLNSKLNLSPKDINKLKQTLEKLVMENKEKVEARKGTKKERKKGMNMCQSWILSSRCGFSQPKDLNFKKASCNTRGIYDNWDENCQIKNPSMEECECKNIVAQKLASVGKSEVPIGSSRTKLRVKFRNKEGRLRRVYPVCMLQYSTTKVEGYSQAALAAHLGSGQCPVVNDPYTDHPLRNVTLHDGDDDSYVIAKGTLTTDLEESFKEIRALFPRGTSDPSHSSRSPKRKSTTGGSGGSPALSAVKSPRKSTVDYNRRKTSSVSTPFPFPGEQQPSAFSFHLPDPEQNPHDKPLWDVESFPSTLGKLETYTPSKKSTGEGKNVHFRTESIFSKVTECLLKTCFCQCFDDSNYPNKKETIATNRNKHKKGYKKPLSCFEDNVKVVRTTKSEFLYTKPKT